MGRDQMKKGTQPNSEDKKNNLKGNSKGKGKITQKFKDPSGKRKRSKRRH